MEIMAVGVGEERVIGETPIPETGVVEQDGIGRSRMTIGRGIRFFIARETLVPLRVLVEPRTPLLAMRVHPCKFILLVLSHSMPKETFIPRPAFRLEMKVGV